MHTGLLVYTEQNVQVADHDGTRLSMQRSAPRLPTSLLSCTTQGQPVNTSVCLPVTDGAL